jgi:hypothetical protein
MDRPHVNPDDPIPGPEVGFEEIAIDFLEARLNEAASRQTLSRVWCRQQWREDKVGS